MPAVPSSGCGMSWDLSKTHRSATGLGAPYWDMYARGTIVGLTRGTTRAHIARAVLESIAFQVTDLVRAMNEDAPCPITVLRVDGGASVSDIMMQIQADLLRIGVDRPDQVETTAFGAAWRSWRACAAASACSAPCGMRRPAPRTMPAGAGQWTVPGAGLKTNCKLPGILLRFPRIWGILTTKQADSQSNMDGINGREF